MNQYSLNIQLKVARDLLAEVGYAGSQGRKQMTLINVNSSFLASPSRPINGLTTNTAANATTRQPFEGFQSLSSQQTTGTSSYNSLQASLTKRFSHGLSFLASYTFSKALSSVDAGESDKQAALSTGAQNPRDIRGTGYGLQSFDRPHRFVFSTVYMIPFPRTHAVLRSLFADWQAGGIITVQNGIPFNVSDSRGGTLYGLAGSNASWAPGATRETAELSGSVNSRLGQFFNTAAFIGAPTIVSGTTPDGFPVASPGGTLFGNVGRNALRGPGQRNVDLALSRRIRLAEHSRLEFRAEFFNLFNNTNFANPGANIGTPATFGVISATSSSPRVLQFALKLQF
jgi:hypothetical protein